MIEAVQRIAQRVDTFVEKDPKRVVDMWSPKKTNLIHDLLIEVLDMPTTSFYLASTSWKTSPLVKCT